MSHHTLQKLMVRMLFDEELVEEVYAAPERALAGLDLKENEGSQLLSVDRRAWRSDALEEEERSGRWLKSSRSRPPSSWPRRGRLRRSNASSRASSGAARSRSAVRWGLPLRSFCSTGAGERVEDAADS